MAEIRLSPRLETIARLVPSSGGVADVGTDHGYIPVWLSSNGFRGRLCATDIKMGPLENARRTAAEHGCGNSIEFFLCDGLEALDGQGVGTVIIAGMGGENIAAILSAAQWTKLDNRLLILQPMSKSLYLRSWLFENGYRVTSEQLVRDGVVYEILTAQGGEDIPYSPAELLTGHTQLICADPLYAERLDFFISKTEREISGLSASSKAEDVQRLNEMNALSTSLTELKNRLKQYMEVNMPKVRDIVGYFTALVPPELKMDFDNVGLLVGMNETDVRKAVVALDITDDVIDEAIRAKAQIILSHHPIIFEALKQVNDDGITGRKIVKMLRNGISGFCQHTNLDSVQGGVNDALAEKLGVRVEGYLEGPLFTAGCIEYGMGRYGQLSSPVEFNDYLNIVKSSLKANGLRYHFAGMPVHRVALCGGSGGEFVEKAVELGCDTLVTSDVKYDRFLAAKALNLNLIDADHFSTENVVVPVLAELLKKGFPDVEVIISSHCATAKFYC